MQRKANIDLLQQLDDFIPTLFSVGEVSQSDRSKNLIHLLSLQANELLREISATRINNMVRRYLSVKRVERMRKKLAVDTYYSGIFSIRLLEEVCTAFIVKVSLDLCELHNETVATKDQVTVEIIEYSKVLLDEVINEIHGKTAIQSIKEAVQSYMDSRPKIVLIDPDIQVKNEIYDTTIIELLRTIARMAIREEVDDYFLTVHALYGYNKIITEIIKEVSPPIIRSAFNFVEKESCVQQITDEVTHELTVQAVNEIFASFKDEYEAAQRRAEQTLVEASMKEVIVRRLALSHLMMGLSDGFQNVLMEHYMLSMIKRLAAIRLLAVTDIAEQEWNSVIDSKCSRELVRASVTQPLQMCLIDAWKACSIDMLDEIDLLERNP